MASLLFMPHRRFLYFLFFALHGSPWTRTPSLWKNKYFEYFPFQFKPPQQQKNSKIKNFSPSCQNIFGRRRFAKSFLLFFLRKKNVLFFLTPVLFCLWHEFRIPHRLSFHFQHIYKRPLRTPGISLWTTCPTPTPLPTFVGIFQIMFGGKLIFIFSSFVAQKHASMIFHFGSLSFVF